MKIMVEQFQAKLDDLDNWGHRKNLKLAALPEKVEGTILLALFIQVVILKWLVFTTDIGRAQLRNIQVSVLLFTEKETILKVALKKDYNPQWHEASHLLRHISWSVVEMPLVQQHREKMDLSFLQSSGAWIMGRSVSLLILWHFWILRTNNFDLKLGPILEFFE